MNKFYKLSAICCLILVFTIMILGGRYVVYTNSAEKITLSKDSLNYYSKEISVAETDKVAEMKEADHKKPANSAISSVNVLIQLVYKVTYRAIK